MDRDFAQAVPEGAGAAFSLPRPEVLARRAALKRLMRAFFDERGFLEVETPVRIAAPAPEEYIDCIPCDGGFLRPSPELEMKLLLGAGYEKIYQFGPCFRAGEHGWKHREEFTMLEYYMTGCDYDTLRDFTAELLRETLTAARHGEPTLRFRGETLDLAAEPEVISVAEAFRRFTDLTMEEADRSDRFDELMVTRIEPELGRGRLSFLTDYPASRASLARLKPGRPGIAERWELYLAGVELANAYSELTDGAEQLARFAAAREFRQKRGALEYHRPAAFEALLAAGGLPRCTGCALGFDRLAMILCDAADLGEVRVCDPGRNAGEIAETV